MLNLKGKNKLTKKKKREMIEISKKIKKASNTEKDNKKLRKEVEKEMKDSTPFEEQKSLNKIMVQLKSKILYLILTVLRSFPLEDVFDTMLDVISVFAVKSKFEFNSELIIELKNANNQITFNEQRMSKGVALRKQLGVINVISKLASQKGKLKRN